MADCHQLNIRLLFNSSWQISMLVLLKFDLSLPYKSLTEEHPTHRFIARCNRTLNLHL